MRADEASVKVEKEAVQRWTGDSRMEVWSGSGKQFLSILILTLMEGAQLLEDSTEKGSVSYAKCVFF